MVTYRGVFLVVVVWVAFVIIFPALDLFQAMGFSDSTRQMAFYASLATSLMITWMLVGPVGLVWHRKEMQELRKVHHH